MNFLTSQKMYFGGNILSDNRKTNNVDLILEVLFAYICKRNVIKTGDHGQLQKRIHNRDRGMSCVLRR